MDKFDIWRYEPWPGEEELKREEELEGEEEEK